jgi:hypothetical protein
MAEDDLDDEDEDFDEEESEGPGPKKPKGVSFIDFTKQLLTGGDFLPVRGPLKRVRTGKPSPRILALREMIVKAVARMLIEKGGWVHREVVIVDKIKKGRIWDKGIWEVLGIGYTDASIELLHRIAENNPVTIAQVSEALKGLTPKTLGDQLLIFLVLEKKIAQITREPFDLSQFGWLLGLSPLLAVRYPDLFFPNVASLLTEFMKEERAILLIYLADYFVRSWVTAEGIRRKGLPGSVDRYTALTQFFNALIKAAIATGRPDVLLIIFKFFEEYTIRFGQREAVVKDFKELVKSLRLASQQQKALTDISQLFGVANALEKLAKQIGTMPPSERSVAEKTFLTDYATRFKLLQPELVAIQRELGGEVG